MSFGIDEIYFSLVSIRTFEDESLAKSVLGHIINDWPFKKFTKYGTEEPLKDRLQKGNLQPLVDLWVKGHSGSSRTLSIGGPKGECNVMIIQNFLSHRNSIGGSFPSEFVTQEASFKCFLSWIEQLAVYANPVYGRIQNMMTKGSDIPFDISLRLPEIPWGTIFGKPYIEMFGEEKIKTAPFAAVEKWRSGHLFCKLTNDLLEPHLPMKLRQVVREHLGEDAFMQGSRGLRHYKTGRSPLAVKQNDTSQP